MNSSSKQTKNIKYSNLYYIARIAQRWSLLSFIGLTIIYWVTQISFTVNIRFLSASGTSLEATNSQLLNNDINRVNDLLSSGVLKWAVVSVLITLGLLVFKNVRQCEKRLVLDSVVTIVFCILSVSMSQTIIRSFLTNL
jgi:hypothetical protein